MFGDCRPRISDHLAFGNMESPLAIAPRGMGGYDLRAEAAYARSASLAGFDAVSLAKEHATDNGRDGLAQTLATAGADLIIGRRPHVVQPVEWVAGAGRDYPTLLAYSLGNFLMTWTRPADGVHALRVWDADGDGRREVAAR